MASKFFKAFNFFKKKGTVAPTITQPRQLKKTMEGIRSNFKRFAFKDAKQQKIELILLELKSLSKEWTS